MQPHIQVQNITKDEWLLPLEMFKGLQDDAPVQSSLLAH
jgi:hypothetical protein